MPWLTELVPVFCREWERKLERWLQRRPQQRKVADQGNRSTWVPLTITFRHGTQECALANTIAANQTIPGTAKLTLMALTAAGADSRCQHGALEALGKSQGGVEKQLLKQKNSGTSNLSTCLKITCTVFWVLKSPILIKSGWSFHECCLRLEGSWKQSPAFPRKPRFRWPQKTPIFSHFTVI